MQKQLDDVLIVTDILTQLKNMQSYNTIAKQESGCTKMRGVLCDTSKRTADAQLDVFNLMHDNGWYPLYPENPAVVEQTIQKFTI